MTSQRAVIIGGGAAGFFAAITCAREAPGAEVVILEKSAHFLSKVRISGGGRCNVTHACFDARELTTRYPRGEKALIAPFLQFQAADTVKWFEERGVKLKVESDGRMFPVTDSSQTIIDCLMAEARAAGVILRTGCDVTAIEGLDTRFAVTLASGERLSCERLLLATGGCRSLKQAELAVAVGHSIEPPVPSLFTFHIDAAWLQELAGVSLPSVEASVPSAKLRETGPLLVTHWGLSGPAILRLSAWGARALAAVDYKFALHVNWLPKLGDEALNREVDQRVSREPAKLVINSPFTPLSARLWRALVEQSGVPITTRWSQLGRAGRRQLALQIRSTTFQVVRKSLNKDEFVTCGGVKLKEVNFKTMESRITPGVHFAGELLDIDGITGGFNFQSAWTTGWIAGTAMATALQSATQQR